MPKRIGKEFQPFPEGFEYRVSHGDVAPQATVRRVEADNAGSVGSGGHAYTLAEGRYQAPPLAPRHKRCITLLVQILALQAVQLWPGVRRKCRLTQKQKTKAAV